MSRTRWIAGSLLTLALLTGGCAPFSRLPDPGFDPLPPLFPVQVQWPQMQDGWSCSTPTAQSGREHRACVHASGVRLDANLGFAGAFVDGATAIDQLWPSLLAQPGMDVDLPAQRAPLRAIRPAVGPSRTGRSLWVTPQRLLALFVVDPWVLDVQIQLPEPSQPDSESTRRLAEDALTALVARLQPDPAVLCDPRVAVLRVPWGLSNVASHGRVVFVSQEVDHLDASTVAELRRLASMRREQVGCPPLEQDFSAVEAALRRASRSR